MRTILAVVVAGLALAGCQSQQEIEAQNILAADQRCTSYGFKYGTPEYGQCRQNFDNQIAANRRATFAMMAANRPPMLTVAPIPVYQPLPPPPPTSCSSYVIGNMVQTHCY